MVVSTSRTRRSYGVAIVSLLACLPGAASAATPDERRDAVDTPVQWLVPAGEIGNVAVRSTVAGATPHGGAEARASSYSVNGCVRDFVDHSIGIAEGFPISVFAADLDGDGNTDVVSSVSSIDNSVDKIVWSKNDGQGGFGPLQTITTSVRDALSVFAADLDGDGDIDVLSASLGSNKIAWYENTDGLGGFGPQQIISTAALAPRSLVAADLDGDGDLDVLAGFSYGDKVAWYENTDGQGSFGPRQSITTTGDGVNSVFAADLDGDGDVDVLSTSAGGDKVAWYENGDGQGRFGPQQIITASALGARSVFAADLDGDGDTDVLSANYDGHDVAWYENTDGRGGFGPPQIIDSEAFSAYSVYAADMDGDGDVDVLSAAYSGHKIAWYENRDGLGSFGPQVVIGISEGFPTSVLAADLDGDGDADVLSAARLDDHIAWYEAMSEDCNLNGIPDDCEPAEDCNLNGIRDICETADGTSEDCNLNGVPDDCEPNEDCNFNGMRDICETADGASEDCNLNGVPDDCEPNEDCNLNTLQDICDVTDGTSEDCNFNRVPDECESSADANQNGVKDICEVLGGCPVSFVDHGIGVAAGFPVSVFAADLDGDGNTDILSTIGSPEHSGGVNDKVAWSKNYGLGVFGPLQTITTEVDRPVSVSAADLDGDGDIDVLSSSITGGWVAWYENTDGLGSFGPPQTISTISGGSGAVRVFAADLDGDGDLDILTTSTHQLGNKVAWHENIDGQGSFGPPHTISAEEGGGFIFGADLDGDGDIDVVVAYYGDDRVAWYENTDGLGSYGPRQIITTTADGATSPFAADLDGDGDTDVLWANNQGHNVVWCENADGLGSFGPQQIIATGTNNPKSVFAVDMDHDGDTDVLAAFYFGRIAWYENTDGQGSFGPQITIEVIEGFPESVFAADLDHDGDTDVISASRLDDKVLWYENTQNTHWSSEDCNANGIADGCEPDNDCDVNGEPDSCEVLEGAPPAADAGGPYVRLVGLGVTLDGSSSSDPDVACVDGIALYEWDLDDDGVFDASSSSSSLFVAAALLADHGLVNPGDSNTIVLRVTDRGARFSFASTTLTLTDGNGMVALVAGGDQQAEEGDTVSLAPATFANSALLEAHTATIDWGDGTFAEAGVVVEAGGSGTVDGSHVYVDNGVYAVTVTVTDTVGSSDFDTFNVTVSNTAPFLNVVRPRPVYVAGLFQTNVHFYDAGIDNPAPANPALATVESFTATVDWGDGGGDEAIEIVASLQASTGQSVIALLGEHVYANPGVRHVTATVTDDDGGSGTTQFQVDVLEACPATSPSWIQTTDGFGSIYVEAPSAGELYADDVFLEPGSDACLDRYWVRVLGSGILGCESPDTFDIRMSLWSDTVGDPTIGSPLAPIPGATCLVTGLACDGGIMDLECELPVVAPIPDRFWSVLEILPPPNSNGAWIVLARADPTLGSSANLLKKSTNGGTTWNDSVFGGVPTNTFVGAICTAPCAPLPSRPQMPTTPDDIRKNRFVSISPSSPSAMRVELLDLACETTRKKCSIDSDCRICDGGAETGDPCSVNSDCPSSNCVDSGESCVEQSPPVMLGWVSDPVADPGDSPAGTYVSSMQKAMPAIRQWPESVVHLSDCEIAPAQTYGVSATTDGTSFSSRLVVATTPKPQGKFWADLVGNFDGVAWSGPNWLVNVDDVSSMIKFLTDKPAPHITVVDLVGAAPTYTNCLINATDLQMVLSGFKGDPFPPVAITALGYPVSGDVTLCP